MPSYLSSKNNRKKDLSKLYLHKMKDGRQGDDDLSDVDENDEFNLEEGLLRLSESDTDSEFNIEESKKDDELTQLGKKSCYIEKVPRHAKYSNDIN